MTNNSDCTRNIVTHNFLESSTEMATPFLVGLGVAGAALTARTAIQIVQRMKGKPIIPKLGKRDFYQGGFLDEMSRREAAQILNVRETAEPDKIKAAHRRLMIMNHPDRGGSPFIASKINEAKDYLAGNRGGNPFDQ